MAEVHLPYWQGDNGESRLTLYCGDAREILPQLDPVDVIVTDPVWPGAAVELPGSDDPCGLFAACARHFPRLCRRLIVVLGQRVDPRFLTSVPDQLPFLRACWLRYLRPRYRGPILDGADLAYIFGEGYLPGDGTRVLPGEAVVQRAGKRDSDFPMRHEHPTPRNLAHMEWLVAHYSRPGQTILDPFVGSGTTLVAAANLGRHGIGIDISPVYCAVARARAERAVAQRRLALGT